MQSGSGRCLGKWNDRFEYFRELGNADYHDKFSDGVSSIYVDLLKGKIHYTVLLS